MELFITLFYLVFSFFVIVPPTALITAGVSIPQLFSTFLGSENVSFIQYHIRRTILTTFIHSCLPLGYVVSLFLKGNISYYSSWYSWQLFATTALIIPILTLYKILEWARDDFANHPIAKKLQYFGNRIDKWTVIAVQVNEQFRSIEKCSIELNSTTKIIATNSWIIKVGMYNVHFANQSNATVTVTKSETHELSTSTQFESHFLNIKVDSARHGFTPFEFKINATDYPELAEKIAITILPDVALPKDIMERFIDVFRDIAEKNPISIVEEEPESCIGCMQVQANVKLTKYCDGTDLLRRCTQCFCKPMWCVSCMARWFATRQQAAGARREAWLGNQATCPMCRAVFCLADVCFVAPPPT